MTEFYGEWQGSAKKLLDNNLVLVTFVSPPENIWTNEQKKENLEKIQKGINWIKNQALNYNQNVNLEIKTLGFDKDILLKDLKDGLYLGDNLTTIAKQIGFANFPHILSDYRMEYRGYNVVMIIAVNISNEQGGISNCTSHGDFEYGVLYPDIRNENRISEYTVAHELLHAYSAPDLYAYSESIEEIKAQENAIKHIKKDIMLCEVEGKDFEISEYTAFTIGWHNDPKDWYKDISPPSFLQSIDFMMKYSGYFDDGGILNLENATQGRGYSFEYGEVKEWFFGVNEENNYQNCPSLWTFEEDGEDEYIATVLMRENSIDNDYIFIKNSTYSLQIPLKDGKGKVLVNNTWQDWYDLSLQNMTLMVHYEKGFLKKYEILNEIIWYWEEDQNQLNGFFEQYNEMDNFLCIKNDIYKFKIPKIGGMAEMTFAEYKKEEWINWYNVTVSYF